VKRRDHVGNERDAGAALILAIGFVVMVGSIGAGLAALVTTSLNNRYALEQVRNRQYSADGAITEAISQVRAAVGGPLDSCTSAGGSLVDTMNHINTRVEWVNACRTVIDATGAVVAQRNVIFSACEDTGSSCSPTKVIIRAQVNFQQSQTGAVTKTFVQSWSVNL
jgi:hypothetical protein